MTGRPEQERTTGRNGLGTESIQQVVYQQKPGIVPGSRVVVARIAQAYN
jgi:hypothetical protein